MPAPAAQSSTKYLVFNKFETMDTQQDRYDLSRERSAWIENLQPIGQNKLKGVSAAAAAALATLTGTTSRLFYANYNLTDFIIRFNTAGKADQVNASSGAVVNIAANGTFSTVPDMTQWKSERILIADATAGYSEWDGATFVRGGGVSPVFVVTAGGAGYTSGATAAITTGGAGVGATASVQVVGGVVVGLTLTAAGSGFVAGDTITVTISPVGAGAGATATGKIWPILSLTPTTIAVFQGRVWLAGARVLFWTGTGGFDDSALASASGQTTLPDADLVRSITALRSLNNYLYIFGDTSIKQIGTITVSGSTTLFAIITLSSDQGTTFPLSIASYNRLVIFANKVGIYAVFGASVEKISNEMDGIFQAIDFSQELQAAENDMNNIRCYLLLVRYIDPVKGTRSLILAFQNKRWFVVSQGNSLAAITSVPIGGALQTFGSSGTDVTALLSAPTVGVSFLLITALSSNGAPHMQKRTLRIGVAQSSTTPGTVTGTSDSENNSIANAYSVATPVVWINVNNQQVIWVNGSSSVVTFTASGFVWERFPGAASGICIGASLSGTFAGYTLNSIVMEYVDGPALVSKGAV